MTLSMAWYPASVALLLAATYFVRTSRHPGADNLRRTTSRPTTKEPAELCPSGKFQLNWERVHPKARTPEHLVAQPPPW